MLKAVLFDLDDTLFDHRHSSRAALQILQKHFPAVLGQRSIDELEQANLSILNEIHIDVLRGTIDVETARQKRFATLFSHYGLTLTKQEQVEISEWYRTAYRKSWRASEGAIAVLKELRNRDLRIGIISNNLVAEQMEKLTACGLLEYIDSLTISEEAGTAKPDREIFEIALDRLNCKPDEVAMIGDAWENDIVPARALGIRAIWFNSYETLSPDESVPSIIAFSNVNAVLRLIISE